MATSILTFFLGSGIVGIISIIITWKKFPIEKQSAKIEDSEKTVNMALNTLTAVHTQYQEVLNRLDIQEEEILNLKVQFQEQKSIVSKLKDYILFLFDNWESIRHNPNPPKLNTEIHTTIFTKDDE